MPLNCAKTLKKQLRKKCKYKCTMNAIPRLVDIPLELIDHIKDYNFYRYFSRM